MKKHYFNSLSAFYAEVKNVAKHPKFGYKADEDRSYFTGLPLAEILKSKYSYQPGVEKLRQMAEVKAEADIRVKVWNQFDGFDIDVDRMYDNLDFLLDTRIQSKRPKTADLYINITEAGGVSYEQMLNKAYTALRITDTLEALGVRTAVYVCLPITECIGDESQKRGETYYIEITLKNHADSLNLGALCTAISPWFFRYWVFLYIIGHNRQINTDGVGYVTAMPEGEAKGIVIETGRCLNLPEANQFIQNLKVA